VQVFLFFQRLTGQLLFGGVFRPPPFFQFTFGALLPLALHHARRSLFSKRAISHGLFFQGALRLSGRLLGRPLLSSSLVYFSAHVPFFARPFSPPSAPYFFVDRAVALDSPGFVVPERHGTGFLTGISFPRAPPLHGLALQLPCAPPSLTRNSLKNSPPPPTTDFFPSFFQSHFD